MHNSSITALVCALVSTLAVACSRTPPPLTGDAARLQPAYDEKTGRLKLLTFDSRRDGKIDTWSYMDGARLVRIEMDRDHDGKIDRWEYYSADPKAQRIEKVGLSRANDGVADAWAYPAPDGTVSRMEISTRRDGKVSRTEFFEAGVLARVEEDTDGDGRIDKWETHTGGALTVVAFDDQHRGVPTRRLVYLPDGRVRAETDPTGSGTFTPAK